MSEPFDLSFGFVANRTEVHGDPCAVDLVRASRVSSSYGARTSRLGRRLDIGAVVMTK